MVKKKNETVIRYCRDCALSKPDMKFENLSLDGQPTLLSCPERRWKMVICTTDVCERYTVKNETSEQQQTAAESADDWLAW